MAVVPKHASTVVLMDSESRIYLTKRPKTMKFMGGFYVFPGGGIDDKDHIVNKSYVNTSNQHHSLMMAHYIAAARELFEEVGIMLGSHLDGSAVEFSQEKAVSYRQRLLSNEISFGEILERERIFFDFSSLSYIGQLITPKDNPIRFDTRFFLANLPQGQEPYPDLSEIDDAFWIAPQEAIDLFKKDKIQISPPTLVTIEMLVNYLNGGRLELNVSEEELLSIRSRIMKF